MDRTISEIRAAGTKDRASLLIVCVCILYSCVFTWIHKLWLSYCTMLNNISTCWLWTKRMNIRFFLFPPFHHYYCLIYTCVEVFFYCLGWLRYTFSFIHLNKIFILLNYKIMLVLLVFHSIAIKKEFSIRLTYIIQNLYNILKYIMQCLRQALSEPTTLQLPIK